MEDEYPFYIFAGQRNSGKSYVAAYLIYRMLQQWRFRHATVFVLTGTSMNRFWQSQRFWKDGQKPLVFGDRFGYRIDTVIQTQTALAEKGMERNPVILVLDDFLGLTTDYKDQLEYLATSGRHLLVAGFLMIQHYTGIKRAVRVQADATFVFKNLDYDTIETIWKECVSASEVTLDTFRRLYTLVVKERVMFVVRKSAEGGNLSDRLYCFSAPPKAVIKPPKL